MGVKEVAPYRSQVHNCRFKRITDSGKDEKIIVFPRTFVFNVTHTDMASQSFEIEFQLSLTWEDPEFVEEMRSPEWRTECGKVPGGWQEHMRQTSWHPSVVLANCIELFDYQSTGQPETWYDVCEDLKLVTFKCRIHGVFAERFELQTFPFDTQPLSVRLRSSYDSSRVIFAPSACESEAFMPEAAPYWARLHDLPPAARGRFPLGHDQLYMAGITLEEWELSPLLFTRAGTTSTNFFANAKSYPTLVVEVALKRVWTYYLSYVLIFSGAICSLGFGVIFTPPDAFHDRCSISLTLLLASVGFKYTVAEKLPEIAYNTMVDEYVIVSFVVLVLIVVSNMASAAVMWHFAAAAGLEATGGNWTWRAQWPGEAPEERYAAWIVDVSALGALLLAWIYYHTSFIRRARAALAHNYRKSLTPAHLFDFDGLSVHADAHRPPAAEGTTVGVEGVVEGAAAKSRTQIAPERPPAKPLLQKEPTGMLMHNGADDAVMVWRPKVIGGPGGAWEVIYEERRYPIGLEADPFFAEESTMSSTDSSRQAAASWCVSAGRDQATVAVSRSSTLAGVLKDFWTVARSFAEEEGEKGRQRVLALPCWEDGVSDPELFQKLLQHILDCAEICEYVGDSLMIAGRHPSAISHDGEPESAPCPMLLLRAFTQKALDASTVGDGDSPYGGYDPYADTSSSAMSVEPESITSDAEVIERTREWVEGIICDMKVCPFSSTADVAGIPAGGVSYPISHAATGEEVYEAFWSQVLELAATDERTLATVLLLTPRFAMHSAGGYDLLAGTLNGALDSLKLEDDVQLVFFHPGYAFRDGKERLGGDGAANYARRSPFPMINLLRTPQVRAAQKGLPTGSVYEVNEKNLETVGCDKLQEMLDTRDWTGLKEVKFMKHTENTWK